MDGQNSASGENGVEMPPHLAGLLDEALSGGDPILQPPDDLADRIVARTRQGLPRVDVVARISPMAAALRWGGALAASLLIALSASMLIIASSGPAPTRPVRMVDAGDMRMESLSADAMVEAIEGLEADIESLMTNSAWETTYSDLDEELAWWEFNVGDAARMDQF